MKVDLSEDERHLILAVLYRHAMMCGDAAVYAAQKGTRDRNGRELTTVDMRQAFEARERTYRLIEKLEDADTYDGISKVAAAAIGESGS